MESAAATGLSRIVEGLSAGVSKLGGATPRLSVLQGGATGITKDTKEVCENFTNVYYGTYSRGVRLGRRNSGQQWPEESLRSTAATVTIQSSLSQLVFQQSTV